MRKQTREMMPESYWLGLKHGREYAEKELIEQTLRANRAEAKIERLQARVHEFGRIIIKQAG